MSAEDGLVHFPLDSTIWEITKLRPWAGNPRVHSDAQVAEIAASILELGFNDPIEITPDGEVLAGHGRLLAAKVLNLSRVPVQIIDHLTPAQKAAYRVANNKLALKSSWDDELLAAEFKLMATGDIDPTLTGFTEEEIAEILADEEEPAPEPGPSMIIYTITFENVQQRDTWKAYLRWLQKEYPDETLTIAARVVAHITDSGSSADEEEDPDAA